MWQKQYAGKTYKSSKSLREAHTVPTNIATLFSGLSRT